MSLLEAVFLGILQGLTEFLPISSSGHLVLSQHLLGIKEPQLFFDIMLHVGTLGAIFIAYHRYLGKLVLEGVRLVLDGTTYRHPWVSLNKNTERLFIAWVVVGTVPAVLVGFFLEAPLEQLFGSPALVAVALIATGLILQIPRVRPPRKPVREHLGFWDAARIGCAQAFAIIPGISRSGSTISIGLTTGLTPDLAARYSFLMSIPAILGALLFKLKDVSEIQIATSVVAAGTLASLVVGYLAIRWLLSLLNRGRFAVFSYYCWGVALAFLIHLAVI